MFCNVSKLCTKNGVNEIQMDGWESSIITNFSLGLFFKKFEDQDCKSLFKNFINLVVEQH